eukprot:SAG25_NODE_4626_length_779_cov_1.210294_2_plen_123_part_00
MTGMGGLRSAASGASSIISEPATKPPRQSCSPDILMRPLFCDIVVNGKDPNKDAMNPDSASMLRPPRSLWSNEGPSEALPEYFAVAVMSPTDSSVAAIRVMNHGISSEIQMGFHRGLARRRR